MDFGHSIYGSGPLNGKVRTRVAGCGQPKGTDGARAE